MQMRGTVAEGFEPLREALGVVLEGQPGTGAAVAAWHDGRWVADLWGGYVDPGRTRAWERDTLVMPYSVTKPFAALCVLVLADRGVIDLDAPMATYWPELRAPATVRETLAHQSGLVLLDDDLPAEAFYDWDLLCRLLARQEPLWQPGTAHGESALLYGHLVGEVVRRVDGRSLGRFLREEVCGPLGLDFHVGLGSDELGRVADLTGFDGEFRRGLEQHGPVFRRALGNPRGALDPDVVNGAAWRSAEVPAVNGHGSARAVAGMYVALQRGELLSHSMVSEATTIHAQGVDRVLGAETAWGLGFGIEPGDGFGMGGVGGSFGWWSASGQYAFAFLTGHIGDHERGDRLENAFRACLGLAPV